MHRPRVRLRLRVVLLGALAAGLTAGAAAPALALTVGIADNKPDMFGDPRFHAAGVRFARLSVGWDALSSPWQVAEIDAWLGAARAANVEPLVSFGHSRTNRRSCRRRSASSSSSGASAPATRGCRSTPPGTRPTTAASRPATARASSPPSTANAARVPRLPDPRRRGPRHAEHGRWVRAFRRAAHEEPRYWGLHNYVDANRRRTRGTRRLLRAVKGLVWFTETGGIVARHNPHRITFPESSRHAAVATRFVFRRLAKLSRRVTRVYIYQWNAGPPPATWDSGLVGPTGRVRPAYYVVARALGVQAARDAARQTGGTAPAPRP